MSKPNPSPSATVMTPSSSSQSLRGRPKRSSSQNIDYNLKKIRKIITSDYDEPTPKLNNNSTENKQFENSVDANNDILNVATGLPLNKGPTDKIKKERLWNFKRITSSVTNGDNSNNKFGILMTKQEQDKDYDNNDDSFASSIEARLYIPNLKTKESKNLVKPSNMRQTDKLQDGHEIPNDITIDNSNKPISKNIHIKFKESNLNEMKKRLLATSNSTLDAPKSIRTTEEEEEEEEENSDADNIPDFDNDDFCSACLQTGSFLCCDTCPRSFHFLCLDPPIDPNHLPEGDWSCPSCTFNSKYQVKPHNTNHNNSNTNTHLNAKLVKQDELNFLNDLYSKHSTNLFGKLLFQSESFNPKQFSLPNSIRSIFKSTKSDEKGNYIDSNLLKLPLSNKQLYESAYGQSVTKLDSYYPENHYDENNNLLICYKCKTTKLGTWDNPGSSRLLIKCDYCNTPWHLDCVPNVPRASLKNLGNKWKCPLHASTTNDRNRNLSNQDNEFNALQSCHFENDGNIEVQLLDEITSISKTVVNDFENDKLPILNENSIKLDFLNKIFNYKQIQKIHDFNLQKNLIDKLTNIQKHNGSRNEDTKNAVNINDLCHLLYFKISNDQNREMRKLWDFSELCNLAGNELKTEKPALKSQEFNKKMSENVLLESNELSQLLLIKHLIQSKPKDEVIKFFNLDDEHS
ncbi:hypothetical protein KAFR_0A01910 [Kazachstania africana CBS 2517]|uniref:PHD-type domain-containing protein n=1 Tax=Kazachstania africana (strain ATCC 22294 / BCRC 22015 / CBS 2517 / CECT 1963 / NBRC 1671 / NRRL Y-8276) TaxID=1071382 RepID=H2AMM9_KAZAF|nr:hypothetical protein KAFR_0A01910 [Kazachstania africana CBS 2517]CCF55629.1 hypothetical protein KAFR_0A01910 [Kazachstania africana CBS 2517]